MSVVDFAQGVKALAKDRSFSLMCTFGEVSSYDPHTHAAKFLLPLHRDSSDNPILTGYVPLVTAFNGPGYGAQFPPPTGAQALLIFIDGEKSFPVAALMLYNSVECPPFTDNKTRGWQDAKGNFIKTTDDGATGGDGLGGVKLTAGGYANITAPKVEVDASTEFDLVCNSCMLGAKGLSNATQGVVRQKDLQAALNSMVTKVNTALADQASRTALGSGVSPGSIASAPTAGCSTTVNAND